MTPDTRTTENPEPRTEAGRRLVRLYAESPLPIRPEEIAEVEAEAAQGAAPLDESVHPTTLDDCKCGHAAYRHHPHKDRFTKPDQTGYCEKCGCRKYQPSEGAAPRAEGLTGCDIDGDETLRDWALRLADERVEAIVEPHELTHARHRRDELRAALAAPRAEGLDDPLVTIKGLRITADQIEAAIESLGRPGYKDEAIVYTAALATANTLRRFAPQERRD